MEATEVIERPIRGNVPTDVAYLARVALCARSVGRVELRSNDDRLLGDGRGSWSRRA